MTFDYYKRMHLVLGSRSERGGARRAPTKRDLLPIFSASSVGTRLSDESRRSLRSRSGVKRASSVRSAKMSLQPPPTTAPSSKQKEPQPRRQMSDSELASSRAGGMDDNNEIKVSRFDIRGYFSAIITVWLEEMAQSKISSLIKTHCQVA